MALIEKPSVPEVNGMVRTVAVVVCTATFFSFAAIAHTQTLPEAFYSGEDFMSKLPVPMRQAYVAGVIDTVLLISRTEHQTSGIAEETSACIRLGRVLLPDLVDYRKMVENHLTVRPAERSLSTAEAIVRAIKKECGR